MTYDTILQAQHYHVWTASITGMEYANAIYESEEDAALNFLALAQHLGKYFVPPERLNIETVMNGLKDQSGVYVGSNGLVVVVSKCEDLCESRSVTWN